MKRIILKALLVLIILSLSTCIAFTSGRFILQNNNYTIVTNDGIKLEYKEGTILKDGDRYCLVVLPCEDLEPGCFVTVTPVQIRRKQLSNNYDCFVRYRLKYSYSLDSGVSFIETNLFDAQLHLSIFNFSMGENFLSSNGDYIYLTTQETGTATSDNLKPVSSLEYITLFNLTYTVDKDVPENFRIKIELEIDALHAIEEAVDNLWGEDLSWK